MLSRRLLRQLPAVILALVLGSPAVADGLQSDKSPKSPTKPSFAVPAARMAVEGDGVEAWTARLENAAASVREAQQNAEAAAYNYKRARTRRYPRGEALQEIRQMVVTTRKDLDEAETTYSRLVEEARRAGTPAGILTPHMDFDDEIQQQREQREPSS